MRTNLSLHQQNEKEREKKEEEGGRNPAKLLGEVQRLFDIFSRLTGERVKLEEV